jgi:hypothetical protein
MAEKEHGALSAKDVFELADAGTAVLYKSENIQQPFRGLQ